MEPRLSRFLRDTSHYQYILSFYVYTVIILEKHKHGGSYEG
jgi:hypothetical protein